MPTITHLKTVINSAKSSSHSPRSKASPFKILHQSTVSSETSTTHAVQSCDSQCVLTPYLFQIYQSPSGQKYSICWILSGSVRLESRRRLRGCGDYGERALALLELLRAHLTPIVKSSSMKRPFCNGLRAPALVISTTLVIEIQPPNLEQSPTGNLKSP
jgi:hypothetical protein